jgi:hypothetical protein
VRQLGGIGTVALGSVLAGIVFSASTVAEAHFKINMPLSWMSQDTVGGPQKTGPCAAVPNVGLGDSPGTATRMVTVFQSGQTIPISVTATIAHPGWWRVALVEGASSTQTLATPARPCTLQVIMVMTDHPASDCYYHHCADFAFASSTDGGSSPAPDASVSNDAAAAGTGGARGAGGTGSGGNAGGSSGTGGVSGTGGLAGTGGSPGSGGALASTGGAGPGGTGGAISAISSAGGSPVTPPGSGTGASGAPAQSGSGSGCGCRLASGREASWSVSAAGLIALALMLRRRPRR